MQYHHISYEQLEQFCIQAFEGYGFDADAARRITDVLLAADLCGIESHGIQRMIRYHKEITGGMVKLDAKPEVVFETPLSAVIEGNDAMGQILGVQAMQMAIGKAKKSGFGMVTAQLESLRYCGLLCQNGSGTGAYWDVNDEHGGHYGAYIRPTGDARNKSHRVCDAGGPYYLFIRCGDYRGAARQTGGLH